MHSLLLTPLKSCQFKESSTVSREDVKYISQWNLVVYLVTLTLVANLLHSWVRDSQHPLPRFFSVMNCPTKCMTYVSVDSH